MQALLSNLGITPAKYSRAKRIKTKRSRPSMLLWIWLVAAGLLPLCITPGQAQAGDIELAINIRHAIGLFDARRYRDAEFDFKRLRLEHLPIQPRNLDSYLNVLDYLARSISQQGESQQVLELLQERHVLVAQHYHPHGFVFANSMLRLAEAMYRDGNRSAALNYVDYAISLYRDLKPAPQEAIALAQSNRLQYKVASFNQAMLPADLSDFYTRCEILNSHLSTAVGIELMSSYVEVGVDYLPDAPWSDYFDIMLQQHHAKSGETERHHIFLPHSSEQVRGELCFVSAKTNPIINAESDAK